MTPKYKPAVITDPQVLASAGAWSTGGNHQSTVPSLGDLSRRESHCSSEQEPETKLRLRAMTMVGGCNLALQNVDQFG
jgi:hypothetical protein